MSGNVMAVHEARVRAFDEATKVATVVMPGPYGMEPIEAAPFIRQAMNTADIENLAVGDRVLVTMNDNEPPEWISTHSDWFTSADQRYAQFEEINWTPTISNHALGVGGTVKSKATLIHLGPLKMVNCTLEVVYGTGTLGPSGDMSATLPFACPGVRFTGYGYGNSSTLRFPISWYTLNVNSNSGLVRPHSYNPTLAAVTGTSLATNTMDNVGTWVATNYWTVAGFYYVV